jgi:ribosomal protein L11 methyltransferase
MTRPWQIRLVVDPIAERAFGLALESVAQSIASFETAPGGPWQVDAIFAPETAPPEIEALLRDAAASIGRDAPLVVASPVPDIDWVAENQRSFPPLSIGRFYVRGSHVEGPSPAGSWPIELDAGIAFGSGEHATTRGCLLAIEAAAKRRVPRRALDLGCGSAILAIGLARAAVPHVLAADIDRDSVRVAAENLRLNAVCTQVRVCVSDGFARLPERRGFDFVVANILARPLMRLAPDLARAVAPGGTLVLSGLLASQEREIRAAYCGQRLAFTGRRAITGWHTLEFRRRIRGAGLV